MKSLILSVYLTFIFCAFGATNLHSYAVAVTPWNPMLSDDSSLTEPQMFAEGIVSTPDNEFGGVFTPDGKEFYFARSVPRSYLYVICVTRFENGRWSQPVIAPFSGRYRDFDAVISPSGSKMFFISDRPTERDGKPKKDYDIWLMEKIASGWGEPRHLDAPINTDAQEWFVSSTTDDTLYFASSRSADGISYIYRSKLINGKYSEPEKLPDTVNTGQYITEPYIAPDGRSLLFSSYGRKGGYGGYDIYISYLRNGTWTDAQNLGPKVNTATRDYSPRLTPDGKYLTFTSERNPITQPLEKPITYDEMERHLHNVLNGEGNIYQIELSAVTNPP